MRGLGSGLGRAPPLVARVLGCACVRVCPPLVPRDSWLGCAVWECVLGFRLHPATPGRGVRVCVCCCARWAGTPPLLAGVCGVGVCVWARVLAAPGHSWLGCLDVCVLGCALRSYPVTPGWGVQRGCVCLGLGLGCAPATPEWGVLTCVCSTARSAFTMPLLAAVYAVGVCAPARSWLRPATPGWGVGVCVCLCARSACTPRLLTGVCGVGVCVWTQVSAAPRHTWLGCWGLCLFPCAFCWYPATPSCAVQYGCVCSGSGIGCAPPLLAGLLGCVGFCVRSACTPPLLAVARHLFLCHRLLRVVRAARVCGTRWPLLLGTTPGALVVACGVPLWRASWPRVDAPRLVRSGPSQCSGPLSRRRGAFPHPRGLRPRLYWAAARGKWRPAETRALCACRWPPPRQGCWACSASYPFGAPRRGCPWQVPPASVLGCVRCGGLHVWTRSLTGPASSCGRRHRPVRVCVCVLSWPGRAGRPPGRVLMRLTFFLWLFLVLSPSARPPLGWGCPACGFSCVFFLFSFRPPCLRCSVFSGPDCLGPWRPVVRPPALLFLFFLLFSFSPPPARGFFSCVFFSLSGFFFSSPSFSFCCAVLWWLCGAEVVCPGLWGVLVRVFVALVLRQGPVFACALLFGAPCLCLLLLCCCLLCCACPPAPHWRCCSSPCCLWWVTCGVARPPLSVALRRSSLCLVCVGCAPPPPRGWLCCAVLRFFFRRVGWCCCLWCVLCCARCCLACLCRVGVLHRVVLFLLCFAVVRCCVTCLFCFFLALFLAFPWCSGLFLFLCYVCAVLCQCACALLSVRCSFAPTALACVSCCCLLCLRVCWWAWLSFFVPWWILVGPGVVCRWCAVECPWVLCRAVSVRVVPPGLVLLCAVLFSFALFGAVASSVVSWGAVRCPGVLCVWRCVLSCLAALCAFCCGVLLPGVVRRCALCRLRPGVSCCAFPVLSALCGVAVRPCSTLVPCSPELCPVVLCCRVVLWCPVLLPCLICFLCLFGFSYL